MGDEREYCLQRRCLTTRTTCAELFFFLQLEEAIIILSRGYIYMFVYVYNACVRERGQNTVSGASESRSLTERLAGSSLAPCSLRSRARAFSPHKFTLRDPHHCMTLRRYGGSGGKRRAAPLSHLGEGEILLRSFFYPLHFTTRLPPLLRRRRRCLPARARAFSSTRERRRERVYSSTTTRGQSTHGCAGALQRARAVFVYISLRFLRICERERDYRPLVK